MARYEGAIATSFTYNDAAQRMAADFYRLPGILQKTIAKRARDLAEPLADDIKRAQSAAGSHSGRMATTTQAVVIGGLPGVISGGSLPYAMGAEYGGQRKVNEYMRAPVYGRAVSSVYSKRTTMQFRPHRGTTGYEFWPTVNKASDSLLEGYRIVLDEALSVAGF